MVVVAKHVVGSLLGGLIMTQHSAAVANSFSLQLLSLSVADRDLFFFTTCRSNNNSSGLSTGCDLPLSTSLSRKTSIHLCLPLQLFLMTTLLCFLPMLAWTRHVAPFLFQCQKTNTFYSTSLCSWVLSIPTLPWLVLRVLPTRKSVFVQVASTMTWMT